MFVYTLPILVAANKSTKNKIDMTGIISSDKRLIKTKSYKWQKTQSMDRRGQMNSIVAIKKNLLIWSGVLLPGYEINV